MITGTPIFDTLIDLMAYGMPGRSGCHGGNCGRPKGVKTQFTTTSGIKYTLFHPSRKNVPRPSSGYVKKSKFKGQFKQELEVPGFEGAKTRVSNVFNAQYGKGDVYEGHGETLFVHRDFKKMQVVVHVIPHDEMNKSAIAKGFRFKNFGRAAAFLNEKFGVKLKLPKAANWNKP